MSKSLKYLLTPLVVAALLGTGYYAIRHRAQPANTPTSKQTLFAPDARTKTKNCVARNAFPGHACTPGAIVTNVTKDQVCKSGYASSIRNVPVSLKNQVYAEYGIIHHTAGEYEVDHL